MVGFVELDPSSDCVRWLIQVPSGMGLRAALDAAVLPVEDVRGGIALREGRPSDAMLEGPRRWEGEVYSAIFGKTAGERRKVTGAVHSKL